ncbi:MAG: ankyrin repeat domain-containing protein [Rhodothermales bacterium]
MDKGRALRLCADEGNIEGIKALVSEGVDINARDSDGFTALHYAMNAYPHQDDKDHLGVVKTLAEGGADIDVRGVNGQTPLISAAMEGLHDVVTYLHQHGADIDARLETGATALFVISEGVENRPLNVTATVTRDGKKVTLTDPDEIRAAVGGHPDDEYYAYMKTARYLIDHGVDVEAALDDSKQTALFHTATVGSAELMAMMLETGRAEVNRQDKWGVTALHYACRAGHVRVAELLIEAGADVNIKESYGFTPLHEAAENNHVEVARFLVEHRADPTAGLTRAYGSYQVGDTPLNVAKKAKKRKAATYLATLN